LRAYRVREGGIIVGKTVGEVEAMSLASGARLFIERIRRGGEIFDATDDMVIQAGDIVAVAGRIDLLVRLATPAAAARPAGTVAAAGAASAAAVDLVHVGSRPGAEEVDDRELLAVPIEGVDIYVTSKAADGKKLAELATLPAARGVFLRKIARGATATEIPILPETKIYRGDILTVVGRTQDTAATAKALGYADRPSDVTDVAFVGAAIVIGAIIGASVIKIGGIPVTLSTSGGALIAGLVFGWLRSVHPTFGRIPSSTLWFMNSVGLNVFIAVVGISAGPGFVAGLQQLGIGLFLWGVFVTTVPLVLGMYIAKYIFRFHPALILGCCAGARTTTAALGMVCDVGKSQVPGLGYTVTYAVGNTLLTIWGMIIVMLMA
jgi:putative transport protein